MFWGIGGKSLAPGFVLGCDSYLPTVRGYK